MPIVSVIIPAYNTAPYIKEALESVFAQTFTDYEVIVINDGSPDTDETERVLAPYRERIIYLKQDNEGTAGARNAAISIAQGRYIALLDADDLWMPEYLRLQVQTLERDPTIDVLYPDALMFGDFDSRRSGKRFMEVSPSNGEVTFESLVEFRCHVYIGVTAKRDVLLRVGLFDPDRAVIEDFDLWLRIVKAGGRIAYHREVLARYRLRSDAQSADLVRMNERQINALDKAARTMTLSSSERVALARSLAFYRATLNLNLAKRTFLDQDFEAAERYLRDANAYFRRWKLASAERLLRFTPDFLLLAHALLEKSQLWSLRIGKRRGDAGDRHASFDLGAQWPALSTNPVSNPETRKSDEVPQPSFSSHV
jgi:glycosyltransferase involved in cell wall biosynthesis